jgi:7-dehydrocholesterol reductase
MLGWGTIAFMPLVHNLHTIHLVEHEGWAILSSPSRLGLIPWFVMGAVLIYVNYDADTQRLYARETKGQCDIWGRKCEFIRAKYRTADGKEHESLLILSGYNGLVRHFHYLPDICLLFMYCSPAGFDCILPHTYFLYLTTLLIDRTFRIDKRCQTKYGKYWEEYCRRVPYRLIPGVF